MCKDTNREPLSTAEACHLLANCSEEQLIDTVETLLDRYRRGSWLTIEQLAELAHMSVRSMQRRLAKRGESFASVSNRVRLRLAAAMLSEGQLSLREIAAELGYTQQTNFIRAFKRATGVTPDRYRANCRPSEIPEIETRKT